MSGKVSKPRPIQIPDKIYDINWLLATGKITLKEYKERIKK